MDIKDFLGVIILFIFFDIIFYVVVMKGLLVKSIMGPSPADELHNRQDENLPAFALELRHVPPAPGAPPIRPTVTLSGHGTGGNLAEQLIDLNGLMRQEMESLSLANIRFVPPPDMKVGVAKHLEMEVSQDIVDSVTKALNRASPSKITTLRIGALLKISLLGEHFKIQPLGSEEQRLGGNPNLQWAWDVVPLKSGNRALGLDIALSLKIASGEVKKAYSWPKGSVEVAANPYYAMKVFSKHYWKPAVLASLAVVGTILYAVLHW